MIVSFLQWKLFNKEDISLNSPNLGTLLVDFLGFYSNLNYESTEIKPFNPKLASDFPPFQKKSMMIPEFGLTMQITDPLNNNNNVARSTHKFFYLKTLFYNGFFSVLQVCPCEMKVADDLDQEEAEPNPESLSMSISARVNRKFILKKVLNSAKYFYMLNQHLSKGNDMQA